MSVTDMSHDQLVSTYIFNLLTTHGGNATGRSTPIKVYPGRFIVEDKHSGAYTTIEVI